MSTPMIGRGWVTAFTDTGTFILRNGCHIFSKNTPDAFFLGQTCLSTTAKCTITLEKLKLKYLVLNNFCTELNNEEEVLTAFLFFQYAPPLKKKKSHMEYFWSI